MKNQITPEDLKMHSILFENEISRLKTTDWAKTQEGIKALKEAENIQAMFNARCFADL